MRGSSTNLRRWRPERGGARHAGAGAGSTAVLRPATLPNLYKASVSLMRVAARLRDLPGIEQASCVMGTPANLAQLADAGLAIEGTSAPSDLLIVVRGDADACDTALATAREMLLAGPAKNAGD